MIDDETIDQAIFDYADKKYGERSEELFRVYLSEFPERDWELPEETWRNNFLAWLFFEKVLPETGMTIAEEFAMNTPDLNPEMKEKVLQMKNIIRSDFIVISKKGPIIKIKDMKTGKFYQVKLRNIPPPSPNTVIKGRIFPFGRYHRFTGALQYSISPLILDPDILFHAYEADELKRLESIILRQSSSLPSILNKFPAHWIDWMCEHYGLKERLKKDKVKKITNYIQNNLSAVVSTLTEKARQALIVCLKKGGVVKYRQLKDFDDDMAFFWDKKSPESEIGLLRRKGLLIIGKMVFGDKRYKVAFIPVEFREGLKTLLTPQTKLLDDY